MLFNRGRSDKLPHQVQPNYKNISKYSNTMITVIIANIENSDRMVMPCIVILALRRHNHITIKMMVLLEICKRVIEKQENFVLLEIWANAFAKLGKSFLHNLKQNLLQSAASFIKE